MNLEEFNYDLPESLIAQEPSQKRDFSRLLVLDSETGDIEHRYFYEITDYLNKSDLIVLNDTKVFPARLIGNREKTGGEYEIFLLREIEKGVWDALAKKHHRLKPGTPIIIGGGVIKATILEKNENGRVIVKIESELSEEEAINKAGKVPLPPYIKRAANEFDRERYQTVYAREKGSVAAPTAGLHFTEALMNKVRAKGVEIAGVTLHVGIGTFRPLTPEDIEKDNLHSEFCIVPEKTVESVKKCRASGGKILAVGTTSVRTLETASRSGELTNFQGETDIFIKPPYRFRSVDNMLTNFHLPKSSLLMLVCAFAGRDNIMNAYSEAVRKNYRFYSYGDAMLILGRNV